MIKIQVNKMNYVKNIYDDVFKQKQHPFHYILFLRLQTKQIWIFTHNFFILVCHNCMYVWKMFKIEMFLMAAVCVKLNSNPLKPEPRLMKTDPQTLEIWPWKPTWKTDSNKYKRKVIPKIFMLASMTLENDPWTHKTDPQNNKNRPRPLEIHARPQKNIFSWHF